MLTLIIISYTLTMVVLLCRFVDILQVKQAIKLYHRCSQKGRLI